MYCRPEALAVAGPTLDQFLTGLARLPVTLRDEALVVSDNADLHGTVADLYRRAREAARGSPPA